MAKIVGLAPVERRRIRAVVRDAVRLWPAFHGTAAPLADIHAAFAFMRSKVLRLGVSGAIAALEADVATYRPGLPWRTG